MLDNTDSDNEFDNLLTRVGGREFFENILGGIERQEINSSDSSSSSSSEYDSDSSSESSNSPLYASSESDSDEEETSPLFDEDEEKSDDEETSPLFETDETDEVEIKEPKLKKKTVNDVKKLIIEMSKIM